MLIISDIPTCFLILINKKPKIRYLRKDNDAILITRRAKMMQSVKSYLMKPQVNMQSVPTKCVAAKISGYASIQMSKTEGIEAISKNLPKLLKTIKNSIFEKHDEMEESLITDLWIVLAFMSRCPLEIKDNSNSIESSLNYMNKFESSGDIRVFENARFSLEVPSAVVVRPVKINMCDQKADVWIFIDLMAEYTYSSTTLSAADRTKYYEMSLFKGPAFAKIEEQFAGKKLGHNL